MQAAMVYDGESDSISWSLSSDAVREAHAGAWGVRILWEGTPIVDFEFSIVPGCKPAKEATIAGEPKPRPQNDHELVA